MNVGRQQLGVAVVGEMLYAVGGSTTDGAHVEVYDHANDRRC